MSSALRSPLISIGQFPFMVPLSCEPIDAAEPDLLLSAAISRIGLKIGALLWGKLRAGPLISRARTLIDLKNIPAVYKPHARTVGLQGMTYSAFDFQCARK